MLLKRVFLKKANPSSLRFLSQKLHRNAGTKTVSTESLLLLWFTPWEAVTHLNSTQTKIIGHAQQQKPKTSNSGILYVKIQTVSACWHTKYSHVSYWLSTPSQFWRQHFFCTSPSLLSHTFLLIKHSPIHCQWTHPHNKLLVYCC